MRGAPLHTCKPVRRGDSRWAMSTVESPQLKVMQCQDMTSLLFSTMICKYVSCGLREQL